MSNSKGGRGWSWPFTGYLLDGQGVAEVQMAVAVHLPVIDDLPRFRFNGGRRERFHIVRRRA